MCSNNFNLVRFVEAQNGVYPIALKELQEGRKRSHWMWYIFPQLKHLGYSYNAKYYGVSGIAEATAFLQHPILGLRLRVVSETILGLPSNNARSIFGDIDSLKLRSSMTLFDIASPNDIFAQVIDKYFNGQSDNRTISIIKTYGTI
ncbi:MAG: DUF1810 domain-containing protein [Muribaculaceae bacterium]|nr:DUF1810 domain-containing protein [Muribaculaceae bacterium]